MRARAALRQERDTYLERLLDQAIRHRAATIASGQLRAAAPAIDKRIAKALEHIHANLGGQRMTVSSIAASNSTVIHLTRLSSAALGLPPAAYIW